MDYKESWVPKNWCFWTVVLEKTLESSLEYKEIQPVHPKGYQSWVFIGRTDFEAETPKSWLIWKDPDAGKDWGQKEKGTTEDEIVGWHHQLNRYGFGCTPGIGDGQGGLVCFSSWGRKVSDTTEQLNWTEPVKNYLLKLEVVAMFFAQHTIPQADLCFPNKKGTLNQFPSLGRRTKWKEHFEVEWWVLINHFYLGIRDRWSVLTKCGPLENGMANHFNILALRVPWTVWKGKKIGH